MCKRIDDDFSQRFHRDLRNLFLSIFESLILPHLHIQFGCQLHLRKACLFSSGSEHLHLTCFRSLQGNHLLVSAALRHRSRTLSSVLRRSYQTVQSFSQKRKKAVSSEGTTVYQSDLLRTALFRTYEALEFRTYEIARSYPIQNEGRIL